MIACDPGGITTSPERKGALAARETVMTAWRVGVMMTVALTLAGACDGGFVMRNGLPRVTWVALEALDGDRAALTLWLQDADGDAVDVKASWSVGGESGEVTLLPGSAPLVGLPTERGIGSEEGQPHRVIWDLGDVPDGAVTLTFVVDDRPYKGDDGDVYTANGLDPRVGGGPLEAVRE